MIAIIDYGLGNIRAFSNIFKKLDIPFLIASHNNDLKKATKIILPGVGAFDHAMRLLQKSGMQKMLNSFVLEQSMPILGVCVGMQILAHSSEEGTLPGLGLINGIVKKFDTSTLTQKPFLPHMGWNTVAETKKNRLFDGIKPNGRFYFLHSYYFKCEHDEDILGSTNYGVSFSCAINVRNIYGVQFHPEKSHSNGIQLLKNFGTM